MKNTDITQDKLLEELRSLRESEQRYRTLFETASDGIMLIEPKTGRITDVNEAMVCMAGCPREELIGKKLWEVGPLQETDAGLVTVKELQERQHIRYDDLPFLTSDGTRMSVEFSCSVHPAMDDRVIQCTFRDTTQRRQSEEALWKAEARFRALFREASVGIVITGVDGGMVESNRKFEEMLGYRETELLGKRLNEFVASNGDETETSCFRELVDGKRSFYQVETRCLRKDGTQIWALINASLVHDLKGVPQFVIRTVEDISARKRAEKALSESEERFRQIAENISGVFWITSRDYSAFLYVSPAYEKIWGRPCAELYENPRSWLDAIHPADRGRVEQALLPGKDLDQEFRIVRPDGSMRWINDRGFPVPGVGAEHRIVGIAEDITERRRAEEELRNATELLRIQATTDPLTGIFNRLRFNDFIGQHVLEAGRYRHSLSLIMFDIDHFKKINDTYGHQAGDCVLRELARIVVSNIRHADIFARWGGEEFVILSPHTELESARRLAGKLRLEIGSHHFRCACRTTCSFGVTDFLPGDTVESLTRRADDALYRAKAAGRNRVAAG